MRKFLFIILFIILFLVLPVIFGLRYLNDTYLPKFIQTKLVQEASEKFNLDIKIQNIKFDLLRGIVLQGISISSQENPETNLQIERAQTNLLILPIFNQKKIIFPTLNIYRPKFQIIRYPENKFNFPDLLPEQPQPATDSLNYTVLVYKIDIIDAQIDLLDKALEPNVKNLLDVRNCSVKILPGGFDFSLQGKLTSDSQTNALGLSGNFKFETNELKTTLQLDKLDLLPYLVYAQKPPVNIKTLILNNIKSNLVFKNNSLAIAIETEITNGNFSTNAELIKDQSLLNNAKANMQAYFVFDFKEATGLNYVFQIDNLNADLVAAQIPDKVKIEYAKLDIRPDKILIKNSIINTLKTNFIVKGILTNFSDPLFDIKIQSDIDLPIAKDFSRNYFDFVNPYIVEGKGNLNLNLIKPDIESGLEFKGSVALDHASLKNLNSPYELSSLKGVINFQNDKVDWTNLSFVLLEKLFYSKASISDFATPVIHLELYSDKLNLNTKINTIQKNSFNIEYLDGAYYDSKIELSGNLEIKDENNYYADWDIESFLDLEDIKRIEILPRDIISTLDSKGKCKISGNIKGNIKKPRLLNSLLNLNIYELKVHGLKFDNLSMRIVQENQQIKIPESSCQFYNGALYLNGLVDLEKQSLPFAVKILAENVDLAALKIDVPIPDEKLKGTILATTILSGQMDSLKDTKVQGEFLIKDGYLWGFTPLKKLGDFLFIPKYETLVFKEAIGNFGISNNKVILEDVILTSDVLLMSCEGTIDFNGKLDLDIAPKAVTDVTENLDEFEKFYAGVFSESGGIVAVKVTGTVQEPKYQKKIIAMQVLDKMKDEVVNKIKSFTDMIFGTPR